MNVGIRALEFYFPKNYVTQKELEEYDGVSSGKYTAGLGLTEMAFCKDNEDICSIALSATAALLENYKIDPNTIGFLEVGTETLIDKCKTVKSVVCSELLPGVRDIHGSESKCACFAGTQSIVNAVNWVRTNYALRKQNAIVICADIAVYALGPARCTGGAGAIAFLIGPDAPLVLEDELMGRCVNDVYDFYKPIGGSCSEYPSVDGHLSVKTYLNALDECYANFQYWHEKATHIKPKIKDYHAILFHAPFCRLVQKAMARLVYVDVVGSHPVKQNGLTNGHCTTESSISQKDQEALHAFRDMPLEDTYMDKEFNKTTIEVSQSLFDEKVAPNMEFNRRLGNMYTASLYAQLINLIARSPASDVTDKRILLYSYGGGCESGVFSMRFNLEKPCVKAEYDLMGEIANAALNRLDQRNERSPHIYSEAMKSREDLVRAGAPYTPVHASNGLKVDLFPDTYYLAHIDEKFHRQYKRYSC
ncbi:hydroxymethylglutaryl-CoA synthase [Ditylenchus destructor]|nr:hydroxymethylglutaryl-CoA synthase [Ditylenchus destructor]